MPPPKNGTHTSTRRRRRRRAAHPRHFKPRTQPPTPAPRRWLSAANYTFSALLVNQFRGTQVSCSQGLNPELVGFLQSLMPNSKMLRSTAVEGMLLRPGQDCILNLDAILDYFGTTRPLWVYTLALVCYLLGFHALTFWGLLRLMRKERR